jgi:hypothetical protein
MGTREREGKERCLPAARCWPDPAEGGWQMSNWCYACSFPLLSPIPTLCHLPLPPFMMMMAVLMKDHQNFHNVSLWRFMLWLFQLPWSHLFPWPYVNGIIWILCLRVWNGSSWQQNQLWLCVEMCFHHTVWSGQRSIKRRPLLLSPAIFRSGKMRGSTSSVAELHFCGDGWRKIRCTKVSSGSVLSGIASSPCRLQAKY